MEKTDHMNFGVKDTLHFNSLTKSSQMWFRQEILKLQICLTLSSPNLFQRVSHCTGEKKNPPKQEQQTHKKPTKQHWELILWAVTKGNTVEAAERGTRMYFGQ